MTKQLMFSLAIFSAISVLTIWALTQQAGIWDSLRPSSCMPDNCFCEQVNEAAIRQPSNTYSSLAYVLVGALVFGELMIVRPHAANLISQHRIYAGLFSLAAITIGVGSAYFHASLTFTGQFFDVFGMYLMTTFMLVYAWIRLYKLKMTVALFGYGVLNLILALLLVYIPDTRRYLFGLILIVAICFEVYLQRSHKLNIQTQWFNIGLLLFALAYVIWILDNSRIVCNSSGLLQGHAIWHILGAVATGLLYRYYKSEGMTLPTAGAEGFRGM